MKRIVVLAFVVALALVPAACGGDSGSDEQNAAPAASADQPAQPEQAAPEPEQEQSPAEKRSGSTQNGDGGTSAKDADRASREDKPAASGDDGDAQGGGTKPKPAKPSTPEEQVAALSPAERRKLHRDLYKQGRDVCYAYGPKRLAKDYKFPTTNPVRIAELYARAYEQATPSLVLPYQQGCLAGFRKHARNPPKL